MRTHRGTMNTHPISTRGSVSSAIGYQLSAITGPVVPPRVARLPGHLFVAALTLALALPALAHDTEPARDFSHTVPFELGDAEFAPGDSITIQRVTGTSATIRTGETYCVEGTYTLASRDAADVALFATTKSSIASRTDPSQILRVEKGTGTFRLVKVMRVEGYLHVSFYPVPSGSAFGGVYFGQDNGVLRHKGWSYFDQQAHSPDYTTSGSGSSAPVSMTGPNRALLEYLGDPVVPPADMDPAYSKEGLVAAMQTAARNAGIPLTRVEVDASEYPFLVGVVCKDGDWESLKEQIMKLPGYNYTGRTGGRTVNVMNLVPYSVWPQGAGHRINHRVGLRSQVFLDKIQAMP